MQSIDVESTIVPGQEIFPVSVVRLLCESFYGRNIPDQTWSNWRKWVADRWSYEKGWSYQRWLSCDSITTLLAIAHIRKKGGRDSNRELEVNELIALEKSMRSELQKRLEAIDYVNGKGVVAILNKAGMTRSLASIAATKQSKMLVDVSGNPGLRGTSFYKREDVLRVWHLQH